jgi:hypothetical protein
MALLVINPEEGLVREARDMFHICRHFAVFTLPVLSSREQFAWHSVFNVVYVPGT